MAKLLCVLGSPYNETMPTGIITFPFVRTCEYFNSWNDGDILTYWYLRIMQLETNVKSH